MRRESAGLSKGRRADRTTRDARCPISPSLEHSAFRLAAISGVLLTLVLVTSATVAAQTQVPRPPADVELLAKSDLSIMLSWTPSDGAVSYRVYRGLASGAEGTTPIATTA